MSALTADQVLAHDIRAAFGPPPSTVPDRLRWIDNVEVFLDANPIPVPVAGSVYQVRRTRPTSVPARGTGGADTAVAIGPDPAAPLERWVMQFEGVVVTGRRQTGVYRSVHLGDVLELTPPFDRDPRPSGRVAGPGRSITP